MSHLLTHFLFFCAYSGVSIVLFLLLLLSKTWRRQRAHQILAAILFIFLLVVLLYISIPLGSAIVQAILLPLGLAIPYALGPLLYFYIRLTYQPQLQLRKIFWHHMLPFFIVFTLASLPLSWWFYISPKALSQYPFIVSIAIMGMLLMSYYFYHCALLLKRFQRLVKHNYSTLSKVDLHWLNIWVKGLILFAVLDTLTGGLVAMFPWLEYIIYINALYLVGLIWYIGYFGLKQTEVFLSEMSTPASTDVSSGLTQKPVIQQKAQHNATPTQKQQQLHDLILQEALYKDEEVSLYKIAKKMGISDKQLSRLINQEMDTNFYEYINSFRVEAFKKRVQNGDAEHLTLLALAYESGFNSKATFNRIFKQQTGLTPSQFKKQAEAHSKKTS
ncbi:AraC family transcriptional regulator [uncultured Microscilla sp.]|uniref:helix-turn-helix domain-containing protein n=1 Tax=uncultured Microscilla sp. TaxID=432653 RepID=UPI00263610D1|nr:helix-turn-helix domain-containing protein [uncultured Microscilla sp.]